MKEEGDEEKLHLALGEYSSKLKRNGPVHSEQSAT